MMFQFVQMGRGPDHLKDEVAQRRVKKKNYTSGEIHLIIAKCQFAGGEKSVPWT